MNNISHLSIIFTVFANLKFLITSFIKLKLMPFQGNFKLLLLIEQSTIFSKGKVCLSTFKLTHSY
jgi:hypothetical protein